ncbi:hypothetical protein FA95DRAFT_1611462 [Auriscalpium vulgare]|uniref:Uncharacterized protein n=1 Tax=Auriscalpium vulgare TaxID=40419 RepID=A0ACB8RB98_9AGAM|nr:hypothetical protein FA95DRAFT_1611462 [Auriscalpium vulgare]
MDNPLAMLLANGNSIMVQRYMSAVGVAVLLYDHASTLVLELELIWGWPTSPAKVLFIGVRYSTAMAHILVAYGALLSDFVLLVRVYALWDRRKAILRTLTAGYVVMLLCTTAFTTSATIDLARAAFFEPDLFHMCLISKRPKLWPAIWIAQVAYYIFVLIMTIINAAERPRTVDLKLITDLRKDGIVFFVAMIALRSSNIILGLVPNQSLFLMTVWFGWSMATVTITRLILTVEAMVKEFHSTPRGDFVNAVMIEMEHHSTTSPGKRYVSSNWLVVFMQRIDTELYLDVVY